MHRRWATGAGAGARGCGPHHPPVSRKSPARDESSFGCVVQTRQCTMYVQFLSEVCWLLSFFGLEVPVQGELVRARCFRWLKKAEKPSQVNKSRLTLLGGKKAMCRGGGSRAQGPVRAGVVPTTPRSLEKAGREMSHLLVVLCRPGYICSFSF